MSDELSRAEQRIIALPNGQLTILYIGRNDPVPAMQPVTMEEWEASCERLRQAMAEYQREIDERAKPWR